MNNQQISAELTEKETQRDYHRKWFIIDLVGFVILLPGIYFLFLVVNFLFKKFLFKEESDTEISGGVMGIIIALILPGFWIYHLVKWLKFRKECQNFASQSQLENEIERERERERERTKNVLVLKVY